MPFPASLYSPKNVNINYWIVEKKRFVLFDIPLQVERIGSSRPGFELWLFYSLVKNTWSYLVHLENLASKVGFKETMARCLTHDYSNIMNKLLDAEKG